MKIRIEQIKIYKKEMMQWLEKTCIIRKQGEKISNQWNWNQKKIQKEINETKSWFLKRSLK